MWKEAEANTRDRPTNKEHCRSVLMDSDTGDQTAGETAQINLENCCRTCARRSVTPNMASNRRHKGMTMTLQRAVSILDPASESLARACQVLRCIAWMQISCNTETNPWPQLLHFRTAVRDARKMLAPDRLPGQVQHPQLQTIWITRVDSGACCAGSRADFGATRRAGSTRGRAWASSWWW